MQDEIVAAVWPGTGPFLHRAFRFDTRRGSTTTARAGVGKCGGQAELSVASTLPRILLFLKYIFAIIPPVIPISVPSSLPLFKHSSLEICQASAKAPCQTRHDDLGLLVVAVFMLKAPFPAATVTQTQQTWTTPFSLLELQ